MMLKDMFAGASKPKIPKQTPVVPPSTQSAQIQADQENARRAALLSQGRRSTILGGRGNNLGSIG